MEPALPRSSLSLTHQALALALNDNPFGRSDWRQSPNGSVAAFRRGKCDWVRNGSSESLQVLSTKMSARVIVWPSCSSSVRQNET